LVEEFIVRELEKVGYADVEDDADDDGAAAEMFDEENERVVSIDSEHADDDEDGRFN